MKHPVLTYLTLLALTLLAAACAEEECTNLDDPVLNVEFRTFQRNTFGIPRERADTLVIFKLHGVGSPAVDSLDTLVAGNRTSVLLPLSHENDQSAFRMVYRLREDTTIMRRQAIITVQYRRESFFVSDECGFNVRFRDLTVERLPSDPAFDSIRVINNAISETNTNAVNIRMYFKTK
ncbi:MAG: hypothetical protein AVDCRST_MAG56-5423 [uncultured Cytophagales bacterium]|uniref:Lipoprotein n=1 Tax=uncultured Cytophagales bacterium TaxID=158755 RepID=A0A6J4KBN2_9SPHI|nr:MAG: hypothetical protein AVDCRST_MAG56-5423 [uncultured Cytophagales bacterium]